MGGASLGTVNKSPGGLGARLCSWSDQQALSFSYDSLLAEDFSDTGVW